MLFLLAVCTVHRSCQPKAITTKNTIVEPVITTTITSPLTTSNPLHRPSTAPSNITRPRSRRPLRRPPAFPLSNRLCCRPLPPPHSSRVFRLRTKPCLILNVTTAKASARWVTQSFYTINLDIQYSSCVLLIAVLLC